MPMFPNNVEGLIAFYNFMFMDRGYKLPPHLYHVAQAIMDDRIDKLLVTVGPGSGKSMLISIVAPAFRLGQNPTITQIGISAGEDLIHGFQKGVMEWVADSARFARAFPGVKPNKKLGWSASNGMFVTGHLQGDPDATYAGFGTGSLQLTGVHARVITGDDIHDVKNASSTEACMDVRAWYYRQMIGRADPNGCKFILAGRRWHEDDLYGHFSDGGEWVHMNLPAQRDQETELYWDITLPKGLRCCFTDY